MVTRVGGAKSMLELKTIGILLAMLAGSMLLLAAVLPTRRETSAGYHHSPAVSEERYTQ
jgi:hypothetical protein